MTARFRPLTYVPLAILVLGTVAAAAVSVAAAPSSAVPLTWHGPGPSTSTSASDPDQALAGSEARRLLGLVSPDPDWAATSSPPTPSLATPTAFPATPDLVDEYQLWTTSGPLAAVRAWVSAHPPTGSTPAGSGSSSQNGKQIETNVTYGYPATANEFQSRQVLVAIAPLPRGGVGIRVDAQVVWYPSRPANESIPPGITKVAATVYTRGSLSNSTETVLGSATFTDPAVVGMLGNAVDSSPLEVPGPRSCPPMTGPALSSTWSSRAGRGSERSRCMTTPTVAEVSRSPSEAPPWRLSPTTGSSIVSTS